MSEAMRQDWTRGSWDAPIRLLEYGDFECPFTAQARLVLQGLVTELPETVRLAFRHFPIATIHPHALVAAEAAEAAGAQDRFWQMHDLLFENQPALAFDELVEYADQLHLDAHRFERDLGEHRYLDHVRNDFVRGVREGVVATPTIFINGRRYQGRITREKLLAAFAEQVEREQPLP